MDFEFYPIDEALELEEKAFAALYRTGTAILVINYFGLKDLTKQIAFIRNFDKDAFIIEDEFDIMLDAEDILEFTSYDNAKAILAKYDVKL